MDHFIDSMKEAILSHLPTGHHEKVQTSHNVPLTAAEMALLWTQYINDTMAICMLKYFREKIEDTEIEPLIEYALSLSTKHVSVIREIFTHEQFPIPLGFTEQDVNLNAPRLFSDTFILYYIRQMAMIGMVGAGVAIGMSTRSDVSDFFEEMLSSAAQMHKKARKIALSKGVYVRPPFISTPKRVDFVQKQSFMNDIFGKKRPVTAIEITHLFSNYNSNSMGKAMMMAFSQVVQCQEIKEYLLRGKQIATKHMQIFGNLLIQEDLPAPMDWDHHVLDSTVAPFSDKFMLFHTSLLSVAGIGNYGTASGASQRKDISAMYVRLSAEIALFAEDGANLLIDRGWMEEPPQADNRDELARKH